MTHNAQQPLIYTRILFDQPSIMNIKPSALDKFMDYADVIMVDKNHKIEDYDELLELCQSHFSFFNYDGSIVSSNTYFLYDQVHTLKPEYERTFFIRFRSNELLNKYKLVHNEDYQQLKNESEVICNYYWDVVRRMKNKGT